MRNLLLTTIAIFGFSLISNAQAPSYIPANGLIGWWLFTGNANDESGNGYTGILYGPTPTEDRFSNPSRAYSFDGVNDTLVISNSTTLNFSSGLGLSFWINIPSYPSSGELIILSQQTNSSINAVGYNVALASNGVLNFRIGNGSELTYSGVSGATLGLNQWHHVVCQYQSGIQSVYIDSQLAGSLTQPDAVVGSAGIPLIFGNDTWSASNANFFSGKLDDIAIWNRSLLQEEISDMFSSIVCANDLTISPQNNNLEIGSTATFTASTSDSSPAYVWQSDFGQGFQTLNDFGNYSGANLSTLNISNIQLANHGQSVRAISISGSCVDTSNVGFINILDTCITNVTAYDTIFATVVDTLYTTVYDTLYTTITDTIYTTITDIIYTTITDTIFTTVTDTLLINVILSGINPPNELNTMKVFPNPASTHITIDYGNFNLMGGYSITIENALGQIVFSTQINQQSSFIDLNTWTGNGIYFIKLIDPQNNTIENRKIVIQS